MDFLSGGNSILGALVAVLVTLVVTALVGILHYVGLWKTLQKMGRHDFAALVPFYGPWEFARGAGFGPLIATLMALLLVAQAACWAVVAYGIDFGEFQRVYLVMSLTPAADVPADLAAWIQDWADGFMAQNLNLMLAIGAMAAFYLILHIAACYGVARSFGHGIGYMLGLVILPFLFLMVLGCSRRQVYDGPFLDMKQRLQPRLDWAGLVQARKATFGSNAPLALALLGMGSGMLLGTLPGIVLCILALARNSAEKGKPLASAKCTMTTVTAVLGILLSLAMVAALMALRMAANSLYS